MVICLEQGANDLHMVQLMPLTPHHLFASLKSRMASTFWCWLTQVVLEKRLLNGCFSMTLHSSPPPHHNRFMALILGPSESAGARRELLDFKVQGKINRGRHTDHPAGRHSIRTNQCPPPPSPHIFYGPDALPAAQPTVSKH